MIGPYPTRGGAQVWSNPVHWVTIIDLRVDGVDVADVVTVTGGTIKLDVPAAQLVIDADKAAG